MTPTARAMRIKSSGRADLHVIGKDIVRFHTIYWPIILMALGEPLPRTVLGHPWLLFNRDKMSKSKGNVIYGDDLIALFGLDAVRYYLLSELSLQNDGNTASRPSLPAPTPIWPTFSATSSRAPPR